MDVAAARRAIADLEALGASLQDLAERQGADRRRELVDLRRNLSRQIAAIAALCDPLFLTAGASPLEREYRDHLSLMRTAVALHQASWPAVRMNDDPAAYRISAHAAAEARRAFVDWAVPALGQLEHPGTDDPA